MLAKNVNDNACFLNKRGVCEFFASKLAPTKKPLLQPSKAFRRWQANTYVCSYTAKSHHRFSIILKNPPYTSTNRHIIKTLRGSSKKKDKKPNH